MKIAILTSGILPVPSVQGGAVENLIDYYLEYNNIHKLHDITVYSINHPHIQQQAIISNVNHYYYVDVTSIWGRFKRKLFSYNYRDDHYNYFIGYYLEQSLKHLLKQKYDIIVIENRPFYANRIEGKTNAKLIYHLHNELLTEKTDGCEKLYNSAYRIISVSEYITRCVRRINPYDSKCITVYNGIDLKPFSVHNKNIINRSKLGFKESDFIIVFCGRMNKDKGISELIDAMIKLKNITNIKLLVIGSSFYDDATSDDLFISILKKRTNIIKDKIVFTGFIKYNDIPSYLHIADIAVLPSIWDEPFGLTIVESMAAGLPVISTKSGGIPEICEGAAILIERDDVINNLTRSIIDLYNNPVKRRLMSKKSLLRSQFFSKDKYAKLFFEAIR